VAGAGGNAFGTVARFNDLVTDAVQQRLCDFSDDGRVIDDETFFHGFSLSQLGNWGSFCGSSGARAGLHRLSAVSMTGN
jgi:hypothetical protein